MIFHSSLKEEDGFSQSRLPQRAVNGTGADFPALLKAVKALPDSVFWEECFSRNRITKKYTPKKMLALGQMASDCGEEYAEKYRGELADGSMLELCRKNGITVRELTIPQSPAMELFGLFESPNTISIRADLLQECDDYVKAAGISAVLDGVSCGEVLLAHEFFHFLECKYEACIFTCTYTEPQGLFAVPRNVPPLGEIAAMSFAKHLFRLSWNPFMLDCVMMIMDNLPAAAVIAERLLRFNRL